MLFAPPVEPMPMPATDPVTMTRAGVSFVAAFSRSGANLGGGGEEG